MPVKSRWPQHAFRYVACLAAAEIVAQVYRRILNVNPTTVALTFLLMVLLAAAYWGFRFSVFLAVSATLAFNYYFLPPIGTFTVADPQNWVALFAFLVTAGIASELADRARRQTADAHQRRRDVERLYSFSQRLLATDNVAELLNAIPLYVCEGFGGKAAAIYAGSANGKLARRTGDRYRARHFSDSASSGHAHYGRRWHCRSCALARHS
jgi:two-component system sensor histidine kinase KdpD